MKKFTLTLFVTLLVGIQAILAQDIRVTGTVKDASGAPIPGVTVVVDGTTQGASTAVNGNYAINAPANGTLQFSFIGMNTVLIPINNRTVIDVVLESDNQLIDDIIVVAYGTARRESFTGSASTVSAKNIEKLQVSNVTRALEGAAPGVQVAMQSGQPGEKATIRIRGIGSINSSSDPLYIVDGMPFSGDIASLNPADIESMNVLKDAASTSLYGSRAANGVIMITTKKGSAQNSKVTFNARVGVNTRGIPEYDIMKDPGQYMTTFWQVLNNQLGDGQKASDELYGKLGYNPYDTANNAIVDANGKLTTARLKYQDDWEKEAMQTGMRQEYTVTVQGGSTNSSHYLSLGYLDDEGIIANSDYSRLSLRASGDYKVNEFIKLNGSVSYARGEQNSQAISGLGNYTNTFMFTQSIAPIYPVYAYDSNGNRLYNNDGSTIYDFGNGKYGSRAWGSNQNVVASDAANQNQVLRDNVSGRFGVNITFLKDFTFQATGGYDLTNTMQNRFQTPSFGDAEASGGRAYKYRMRTESYTVTELLTYNKTIDGRHNLDVMAGHENYKYKYHYLLATKTNFFDENIPEFSNAITMDDMNSYTYEHTIESYLGRVNYNYDDKYYFSGSLRTDGSSRFSKDNRWGTFWSVGGSWRVSQENFMKPVLWVDNLTVRASYGSVGNDAIYYPNTTVENYYAYKTQYSISNSDGDFAVSKYYQGNPDLTWETSYNFNVGLSATLFKSALSIDVEYFNKKTKDMLYNVPQPMSSGLSYISQNALTMINRGIEFSLGINIPLQNKDMRWSWTLNGTHYTNEVTDIPENKRENGITHATYYNIQEGKSAYEFYTYHFAGLNSEGVSTWYKDEKNNATGEVTRETTTDVTSATKYFFGSALPDFQGGISTDFYYKGFDFSIATNFQLGGKIYDSMYAGMMHSGSDPGKNWHKDILNAWSTTNTDSDIPVLNATQTANNVSNRFLIKASFFNIRNITLGYTLPKNWIRNAGIDNARIYVTADNVALFSKRKGMDPRQYIQGQSNANYSAIRTISGGISLTF